MTWYQCRCGHRWQPEPAPEIGERVLCPQCGDRAFREREAAEQFSEQRRERSERSIPPVAVVPCRPRLEPPSAGEMVIQSDGRKPFLFLTLLGCVLMIAAAAFLWRSHGKERSRVEHYRDWTWKFGKPVGIDRISPIELTQEGYGVKFTCTGDRVDKVEYLIGTLAPSERVTPESAAFDAELYWCQPRESRYTFTYKPDGTVATQSVVNKQGEFLYRVIHDSPTQLRYVDESGKPYQPLWLAGTGLHVEWTADGFNGTIVPIFDADDVPISDAGRFGKIVCSYDSRGLLLREDYQDHDGKSVIRYPRGYAGFRVEYTPELAVAKFTALGIDGRPKKTMRQFATVRIRYDNMLGRTETRYFDENENRSRGHEGCHRRDRHFDAMGLIHREDYFDEKDNPILSTGGHASWTANYDSRGNATTLKYFGVDGKPILLPNGFHQEEREFDNKNRITREVFSDAAERPTMTKLGYTERRISYGPQGQVNSESYYGADARLILVHGRARWQATHDAAGHILSMRNFGADDRPILMEGGYALWTAAYSDSGQLTETRYFGTDEKLVRIKAGYAILRNKYDDKNRFSEEAYFDEREQPCLDDEGIARTANRYDDQGRLVETTNYGVRGELVASKLGYARVVYTEQKSRNETEYFGADGKAVMVRGFAKMVTINDGQRTEQSYYDSAGKLVNQRDGVAKWIAIRNKSHVEVERVHFDSNDLPALNHDGWHKSTRTLSADDRIQEERYFDRKGELVPNRHGFARQVWNWNGEQLTGKSFFDAQGRQLPSHVVVEFVESETDAAKTGIQVGDILVSYGGTPIRTTQELMDISDHESASGPNQEIVVRRGDQQIKLQIPPACYDINWHDQPPVELLKMPREAKGAG